MRPVQTVALRRSKKGPTAARRADFLPTCRADMDARGWDQLDILIISGDAYVDHPAFGPVLIARFLERRGFKVGFIAQPDWRSADDVSRMGKPRLFVGVSAGNLDSMLNKLTAQKKVRSEDQYSPDGDTGCRPNRATIVYSNVCRQAFGDLPIILGGIEASLRRIAHYDYWMEQVRRSILLDAKADLLVFGMGERPVWEIAQRLAAGEPLEALRDIGGTAFPLKNQEEWQPIADDPSKHIPDGKVVVLPSYEEVCESKLAFATMSGMFQRETNPGNARPLLQVHGKQAVYFNPPAKPLDESLMDELYDMPFQRRPHLDYDKPIPAFETVKHSIVTMRGCFGGCTFCSITEHEGRVIQSRSADSVMREVRALSRMPDYKGVISDLGGPTANMYQMRCKSERIENACRRMSCVHPKICENLVTDHEPLLNLMRRVREDKTVRKMYIASGIRYDLANRSPKFIEEMATHHTGGQLSVAPEHNDPNVLDKMKKPPIEHYERFAQAFCQASEKAGKEQYLIPYLITGHPGSDLRDTIELALYLKRNGLRPRQIQDFIPTPMSMATAMFHTGFDPYTLEPVHTEHSLRGKKQMKALVLYWDEKQWPLAREALVKAGRKDLIGGGPNCLVPYSGGHASLGSSNYRGGAPKVASSKGDPSRSGQARPGQARGGQARSGAPRASAGRGRKPVRAR